MSLPHKVKMVSKSQDNKFIYKSGAAMGIFVPVPFFWRFGFYRLVWKVTIKK